MLRVPRLMLGALSAVLLLSSVAEANWRGRRQRQCQPVYRPCPPIPAHSCCPAVVVQDCGDDSQSSNNQNSNQNNQNDNDPVVGPPPQPPKPLPSGLNALVDDRD